MPKKFVLPPRNSSLLLKNRSSWKTEIHSLVPGWMRVGLAIFGKLPLAFLTALSAVVGTAVLFSYFASVGYKPNDLSALFGLGTAVTIFMLLTLLLMAFVMHMPAFFARLEPKAALTTKEMTLSQLAMLALLWGLVICAADDISVIWKLIAGAFAAMTLQPLVLILGRRKTQSGNAAANAIAVGAGTFILFLGTLVFGSSEAVKGIPERNVWLGFFIVNSIYVGINALSMAPTPGPSAVWVFNVFFTMLMFFYIPASGFIPKAIVTLFGIRIAQDAELRVPAGTCKTIFSIVRLSAAAGAKEANMAPEGSCREFGNQVIARVDVRLGSRWLLKVKSLNGLQIDEISPSVTVPDLGTELVIVTKSGKN